LIDSLTVSATSRSDGIINQTISESNGVITITTDSASSTVFNPLWIEQLAALYGLITPLVVTNTSRSAGLINQSINNVGGVTTVTTL
jgi:hypothetical protein